MKKVQIINPAAGHGNAKFVELKDKSVEKYTTKSVGDAEIYVKNILRDEPDESFHFFVCGGDGTINEVVNGIILSDAAERAVFSVVPVGSGNDFVRNFTSENKKHVIDLIKYNNRYAVNMINIGFDCSVAKRTSHYKNKKLISGSMAYILGVLDVLSHKIGEQFEITVVDENDITSVYDGELLFTAIANGSFCGGGFNALPLAELNDGILDMIIVSKISRTKFISLVGAYRSGNYIDPVSKELKPAYKNILKYIRAKKIIVKNLNSICIDGELESVQTVEIEVIPNAITYVE